MRNSLLTLILLIVFTSCKSDQTIGPPDLLYRQWRLLRTREVTKNEWREWGLNAIHTVEYRTDGTMIYRQDGVQMQAGCCKPTKFSRQNIVLNYSDWQLCYNAFCATVKRVTIGQLTDTQLELNDGYTISQYEMIN
jgi:hypothetical protein